MRTFAYIDAGTTGLLAQFAAAGIAGVFVYLRARFRRTPDTEPADDAGSHEAQT